MARGPAEHQMETTARTYFACVNTGDVEGILALFADDAQLIHPLAGGAGIRGKAALRAAYQYFFSHLVYAHASLTEIIIEGHTLVAPGLVEGQTTDGQPIAMHNLNLWTFEHGKFKVLRIYMNLSRY